MERVAVVGTSTKDIRPMLDLGFDLIQVVAGPALASSIEEGPVLPVFFDDETLLARVEAWRHQPGPRRAVHLRRPVPGRLFGTLNVDGHGGGGTGQPADWGRAARVAVGGAITLSGGLRVENLEDALRQVRPHAVDVSSGVETSPGTKDPIRMRAFVQEVRRMEALLAEAA